MKETFLVWTIALIMTAGAQAADASSDSKATTDARATGSTAPEEDSLLDRITWIKGPAKADLRDLAEIQVPEGFMMTGGKGTRELLEAMGNPTGDNELGFLAPTNLAWFVVFSFSDVGFVKDDDKDKLDPKAILKAITEGTEHANKFREEMGASPMKIVGWEYPPKYNEQTHNLEWAIRAEADGEPILNYNTRLLGRKGVMEANLVIEPSELSATLPVYQKLLADYKYKSGQTYAEYRDGDKLAQYGLAALITGGAAAVALKTGLLGTLILFFKKGAKLIIVGVIAIGAFIKKVFFGGARREM